MLHPTTFTRLLPALVVSTALAACGGATRTPSPAPTPALATAATNGGTATATPGSGSDSATGPAISLPKAPRARTDRQLLTRDAILGTQYTNMYDVVLALRGNWLRTRAAESLEGKSSVVQVYLDNQRLSGVDELRQIAPVNVETVRYYDPVQASSRWGMDHGAGAIYILSAKTSGR